MTPRKPQPQSPQPPRQIEIITQEQAVLRALGDIQQRLARIELKVNAGLAANPLIPTEDVKE